MRLMDDNDMTVRIAQDALPRPAVTVTTSTKNGDLGSVQTTTITISRDGKSKSYEGSGSTHAAATGRAVEKMLDDTHTAEWLP